MKRDVFFITQETSVADAALMLVEKHIGALPVVDENHNLVGVLPLRSLIQLVMPDFIQFVEDFDFVSDFGVAETRKPAPALLNRPVREIMLAPESVEEKSGLMRAIAILYQHEMHDLPVVDAHGKLVGILSRVDVGTAFISNWNVTQGG
jgi:CBS-domain-containing membrane protein